MSKMKQSDLNEILKKLLENQKTIKDYSARLAQLQPDSAEAKLIQDKITAAQAALCLDEYNKINFANLIKAAGFDPAHLTGLNFFIPGTTVEKSHGVGESIYHAKDIFKGMDFRGCSFQRCDFSWCNFKDANFEGCKFDGCVLNNTVFRNAKLKRAQFGYLAEKSKPLVDCDFSYADLEEAAFLNVEFQYCAFYRTQFKDAKITNVVFNQSTLIESNPHDAVTTVDSIQFIDCAISRSIQTQLKARSYTIEDSGMQKVGLVWKANWPGHTAAKLQKILKAKGIVPVRIDYDPAHIDRAKLGEEVTGILGDLKTQPEVTSIAQGLVSHAAENKEAHPNIAKLGELAQAYTDVTDGLILPGGLDIEGSVIALDFDRQKQDPHVQTEEDYVRTLLEFELISKQQTRGAPVMGICRGAQMINVFYGGTTHEHIEGQQDVVQPLRALPETNGIISSIYTRAQSQGAGAGAGISFHHQAIDRIGYGLQEVIAVEQDQVLPTGEVTKQKITKAVEGIDQQPLLAIQYHPEVVSDAVYREVLGDENAQLIDAFAQSVVAYQAKKVQMLSQLAEIGKDQRFRAVGEQDEAQNAEHVILPSKVKAEQKREVTPLMQTTHELPPLPQVKTVKAVKLRALKTADLSALLKEIQAKKDQIGEYEKRINQLQKEGKPEAIQYLRNEIARLKKELCLQEDGKINFKMLLQSKNFKTNISECNFSLKGTTIAASMGAGHAIYHPKEILKSMDFQGCNFAECNFSWCNFSSSDFTGVKFTNCDFDHAVFRQCQMSTAEFKDCDKLTDCDFSYATLSKSKFTNSKINYGTFHHAKMDNIQVKDATFTASTFLESDMSSAHFDNTQFHNCVMTKKQQSDLAQAKISFSPDFKRVGIVWKANWPGHTAAKLYNELKARGAVPVKIEYEPPGSDIDRAQLKTEVQDVLAHQQPDATVPQQIALAANDSHPTLAKIRSRVKLVSDNIDGLIIPGGLDIESEFIPGNPSAVGVPGIHTEDDYHRSVLEFALIQQQELRGTPVLGICRGAQMVNTYYGGGMALHVEGQQDVVQSLKPHPDTPGVIAQVIERQSPTGMNAISFHHQAMTSVGQGLQEVISIEQQALDQAPQKIIKAAEGVYQQPVLLTQFHPEVKEAKTIHDEILSKANTDLLDAFATSVASNKQKHGNLLAEIRQLGKNRAVRSGDAVLTPSRVKAGPQGVQPRKFKQIKQKQFEALLKKEIKRAEVKEKGAINLKALLEANGYLPNLEGINLSIFGVTIKHPQGGGVKVIHGFETLKNIDYSDVTFKKCKFTGCNLSGSIFNETKFIDCDFKGTVIENGEFESTKFQNCAMNDAILSKSIFKGRTAFQNCALNYVDLYQTQFEASTTLIDTTFDSCVMIDAQDKGARCDGVILKDCVRSTGFPIFNDAEIAQSDPPKPTVGLLWQPHLPGHTANKIYKQLKANGAIPIRISYLADPDVKLGKNRTGLDGEVKAALDQYESDLQAGKKMDKSRAMYILDAADANPDATNLRSIITKIERYGQYLDATLIPGGADIPPDLYGQKPDPRAEPENNYVRSVIEFALIRNQKKLGNPLMGVCRGCQIMNVYHGGDMLQRVPDKGNFKSMRTIGVRDKTHGIISDLMEDKVTGMSMHHQAIHRVGDSLLPGERLELVADYNGIVKAVQEQHGAPIMMTQFHPEFYGESPIEAYQSDKASFFHKIHSGVSSFLFNKILSNKNDQFIPALIEAATVHKKARRDESLTTEIKGLKKTKTHDEGGVSDEHVRPSQLVAKKRNLKHANNVNQLRSVISNYKQAKRANKRSRIYNFFDRILFSRKEERLIGYINKEIKIIEKNQEQGKNKLAAKHVQNSVEALIQFSEKNPSSLLTSSLIQALGKEHKQAFEMTLQTAHYEDYNVEKEIKQFLDKHPNSELAKAIHAYRVSKHPLNRGTLPQNEPEMLALIDWYSKEHEASAIDLISGGNLADSPTPSLGLDLMHSRFSMQIANHLQGGEGFNRYNELLKEYLAENKQEYPLTRDSWRKFQSLIAKKHINDPLMTDFIRDCNQMFVKMEAIEAQLDAEKNEDAKQDMRDEISAAASDLAMMIMKGPAYQVPNALKHYLEIHQGRFPIDPAEWQSFKASLGRVTDMQDVMLISKVDILHQEWQAAVKLKLENYIQKNPYEPMAKALKQYQMHEGTLPYAQAQWNAFLESYPQLMHEMLFDAPAKALMNGIHHRQIYLEQQKAQMKHAVVAPEVPMTPEKLKDKRVEAIKSHFRIGTPLSIEREPQKVKPKEKQKHTH